MDNFYSTMLGLYPYIAILALTLFSFFAWSAWFDKGFRAALPDIRNNLIFAVLIAVVMPFMLNSQELIATAMDANGASIFTDGIGVGGQFLGYLRWPLLVLTTLSIILTLAFALQDQKTNSNK